MELGLKDKVALITGSGRGLGACMARLFAEEGARIIVTDISEETARASAKALTDRGFEAIGVIGDVTIADDVKQVVDAGMQAFGRIDVLINNAGFPKDRLIVKMTEEDWDSVISVILKGTFLFTRAVVPIMAEQRSGR